MSRRDITRRQWELLRLLQGRRTGLRTVDLVERLEVSRATVDRDLRELRDAGLPIERYQLNGEVRHRFRGEPLAPLALTQAQYVALRLARSQLRPLEGTELVRALDQLLDSLAGAHRPDAPASGPVPVVQANPHHVAPSSAVMRALDSALRSRRQLELRYRAASHSGNERTYHIEPLRLRWVDGDLYLCGYVPARGAARTFKVVRIVEAKTLRTRAEPHPEWTDERLFAGAVKIWSGDPTDVTIRLAPDVAHLAAEYPLISKQRTERRPDGSVLIHARVAGLVEARRWILSWGASGEAVAPLALRQAVQADLERALYAYIRKPALRVGERSGSQESTDETGRRRGERKLSGRPERGA